MTEEPEDMLEHHRVTAAGSIEEAGAEETVGQHHGHRAGQYRHYRDQQVGGDQPGPHEQRHLHAGHAGRAHVHDGGDDVDRAHDGRQAHHVHREDHEGEADAGLQVVDSGAYRSSQRPGRRLP